MDVLSQTEVISSKYLGLNQFRAKILCKKEEEDLFERDHNPQLLSHQRSPSKKHGKLSQDQPSSHLQIQQSSDSQNNQDSAHSYNNPSSRTFTQRKLTYSLTRSLPKPQETNEEDYMYLTPMLEKQNQKLSDQVNSLLEMLEMYSIKLISKKNEKPHFSHLQLTSVTLDRDKSLEKKYKQIRQYRKEIGHIQKQLQETYSIQKITEMQNEITLKQHNLKELKEESQLLDQYSRQQEETIKRLDEQDHYQEQVDELTQELKNYKQKYRQRYYKQIEYDKEMLDRHESLVAYDLKVRELEKQLKDYELYHKNDYDLGDHNQEIEDRKQEILINKQNTLEKKQQSKHKLLKQEKLIEDLEYQVKLLEVKAREKDQENRLAELKMKELQRAIKLNNMNKMKCSTPKQIMLNTDLVLQKQGFTDSVKILRNKKELSKANHINEKGQYEEPKQHQQKFQDDALFITQKHIPVTKKQSRNEMTYNSSQYNKYLISQQYEIEENLSEDINNDNEDHFNFNIPKLPQVNIKQKQIILSGNGEPGYTKPGKTLISSASQPNIKKPIEVIQIRKISGQDEKQQFEVQMDSYRNQQPQKSPNIYSKPKIANFNK